MIRVCTECGVPCGEPHLRNKIKIRKTKPKVIAKSVEPDHVRNILRKVGM